MKHGGTVQMCVLGGLAFCLAADAQTNDAPDSPYLEIINRNVFALKPLPPPAGSEEVKPPPVDLILTGITDIVGKRALMKSGGASLPVPGKVGQPAQPKNEQFYMLAEGQRDGDVEVLEIDPKAGAVKVNNAGQIVTLTFEKNGAKLPSSPAPLVPGTLPGAPGVLPGVPPPPGFVPPPLKTADNPAYPTYPTRSMRTQSQSTGITPASYTATGTGLQPGVYTSAPGLPGAATAVPGAVGVPSGTPAAASTPARSWPPEANVSREEQMILIEAQRELLRSQGNPTAANLLPSTQLTPNTGNNTTPAQTVTPQLPSLPLPGRPVMPPTGAH